jgi:hypothetical protein
MVPAASRQPQGERTLFYVSLLRTGGTAGLILGHLIGLPATHDRMDVGRGKLRQRHGFAVVLSWFAGLLRLRTLT